MDDIRDIKAPVPLGHGLGWPVLAATLCLLAGGGLAVWRWRRLAGKEDDALAEIRAGLGRLAAEAAGLDDRTCYYRLAGLVRQALEIRLGCPATAMTTTEILPLLIALPGDLRGLVARLLVRADPARYAGEAVTAEERLADLQAALLLAGGRRA